MTALRFCAVVAVFALALPVSAARAAPLLAVGCQQPEMFSSKPWQQLGLQHVRIQMAWDGLRTRWQREEIDGLMQAAEAAQATVALSFSHSRGTRAKRKTRPTPRQFLREFRAVRSRYPTVKEFITWDEANHCSQPVCHRPRLAAAYYNAIRRACRSCTIVAADVLDQPNMVSWLRQFRRAAIGSRHIWGIHNYLDANRMRTIGTRRLLRAVKGDVWFTETAGLVKRNTKHKIFFPESVSHAAAATNQVFRLAALSPRVKRIYFYQWQALPNPKATWDSGLLDRDGKPRPSYHIIDGWLRARAVEATGR